MCLNNTSILQRLNIKKIMNKVLKSYIFFIKVVNFQINEIKINKYISSIDKNIQKL